MGGRRTLMRVTDIAITGVFGVQNGETPPIWTESLNYTTDSNITHTDQSPVQVLDVTPFSSVAQSAHLYQADRANNNRAVAISGILGLNENSQQRTLQVVANPGSGNQRAVYTLGPFFPNQGATQVFATTSDLTGDGYDKVIFGNYNNVVALTAADPSNPDAGFRAGALLTLPEYGNGVVQRISALASGQLGGKPQIAALSYGAAPLGGGGLYLTFIAVNKDLSLTPSAPVQLYNGPVNLRSASIVAGRFSRPDALQLVVQYTLDSDGSQYLLPLDFDANGQLKKGDPVQIGSGRWYLQLGAGHFIPGSPMDQVVGMLTTPYTNDNFALQYFSFDSSFQVNPQSEASSYATPACTYDMQVGNFDHRDHPKNASPEGTADLLDQIGVLYSESCGQNGYSSLIYTVSVTPGSTEVQFLRNRITSFNPPAQNIYFAGLSFAPVDLQGRSLILGDPAIVTLYNHEQPSVIIAAPPMHVDAVSPSPGAPLKIINFSAAQDGFYSQFQSESSTGTGQTTDSSNTWSFAATESAGESLAVGDCALDECESVDAKQSATQAVDGTNSTQTGTYGEDSQGFKSATGFGDQLFMRGSTVTDYVYPVIGKMVCPATNENCQPSEKVPMTVQVAGMDTFSTTTESGVGEPAYQPVWMPGNILSYPGTIDQLKTATSLGDSYQELGQIISQKTDGSGDQVSQINWATNSTQEQSSGLTANFSFDASFSYLSEESAIVASGSVSFNLDLSGSYGFSNLTTSETKLAASRGLQITRTVNFADPNVYSYYIQPHIFGQVPPKTVVAGSGLDTDQQTFGALRLAYVVQPISGISGTTGTIWNDWYGQGIDIGLNQPSKWQIKRQTADRGDGSCLVFSPGSSDVDCASLGNNAPNNPDGDEFRYMRGFFIRAAGGNGPQLGTAKDTDQLQLSLRVYNFSLVATPEGSTIHARFYVMPTSGVSAPSTGESILLGEEIAPYIPGFSNSGPNPNWVTINHNLNLASYPQFNGKNLFFWVLVWAQDSTGALLKDLPGHGLKSLPAEAAPGSSARYSDLAMLEEEYGNNMGIYHAGLYISNASQTSVGSGSSTTAEVILAGAKSQRVGSGDADEISVLIRTGDGNLPSGLKVMFYDGDPSNGGRVFATQRIPYATSNTTMDVRTFFRSSEPGEHPIYVVLNPGTRLFHAVMLRPIYVSK